VQLRVLDLREAAVGLVGDPLARRTERLLEHLRLVDDQPHRPQAPVVRARLEDVQALDVAQLADARQVDEVVVVDVGRLEVVAIVVEPDRVPALAPDRPGDGDGHGIVRAGPGDVAGGEPELRPQMVRRSLTVEPVLRVRTGRSDVMPSA
jgi:hypothetical protein